MYGFLAGERRCGIQGLRRNYSRVTRRLWCGNKATPRRLQSVEQAIRGKAKGAVTAASVAGMASEGARALAHNGFKIPLMENLVKRAISA